jgi:hypothetical protein
MEAARRAAQPPAEANSAAILLSLHGEIPKEWERHRQIAEAWSGAMRTNITPDFVQTVWLLRNHQYSELFAKSARERLLTPQILARPGGYYPLTISDNPYSTLLPHVQKARDIAWLLRHEAELAALAGRPDEAVADVRAALVVGQSIGEEPFLISQVVRMACVRTASQAALQVLAWSEPKAGLAELQAELRREADYPWLLTGLRGERGVIDVAFRQFEAGKIKFRDLAITVGENRPNNPLETIGAELYHGLLPGDHAKALELLGAYMAAAKLPPHEQVAAFQAIPLPSRPPEELRYVVTSLILPACQKVSESALRARAEALAASAAIACERFRIANKRWPKSLEEIPKSILPEIPLDPCDGQPLRFLAMEDGVAIYSVGVGVVKESTRQARRADGDPLADLGIGWKLWNPDRRRIPRE